MVASFVGRDVAADEPLVAQGLDSLAAMELRQKLQVRQLGSAVCYCCSPVHVYTHVISLELSAQVRMCKMTLRRPTG